MTSCICVKHAKLNVKCIMFSYTFSVINSGGIPNLKKKCLKDKSRVCTVQQT